ncbi:hypothetical protein AT727_02620 [Desulfitobacterium hafniense]|uniref:D,D-heptose 1,7-bisphosphate phosphatase n=1 Tax=Desulfitobacterium hafniense TaxID=49338 RepID=A0A0W1JQ94_DESHA|nr:HAD family hydrolase [Desulfitobacterium hafniense]KTE93867.1 hypothetical protein AT727_02620 [Desulfitobacterium hafniense]
MSKTVFLDRDGVINKQAAEHDYIKNWGEFEFLPKVSEAIGILNKAGFQVIIVTNQRGVARGMMTIKDVEETHRIMCAELEAFGAQIDGIYVCPHEKDECTCRKPGIGLFLKAEEDFAIDKSTSWMIGDSNSDIEAGKNYGVKTIYIGKTSINADYTCKNLFDAVLTIGGKAV